MSCSKPFFLDDVIDFNGNPIPIPCGHCLSCRVDIQNTMVDRMFCAWTAHQFSSFVTFTYDDKHLPVKEGFRLPTLSKDDVHKYLDNIRHQVKIPFEYYLCGEYGDQFNRPHYHAVFFGLDYQLHDRVFRIWNKGSVEILPVKPSAFRYVAKYITASPLPGAVKDAQYYDVGLIPPFRKLSRGLGLSVYLQHMDELQEQGFFILRGRRISVNRYYFNKLCHFNDRLVLSREQSINDNNRRMQLDAAALNLPLDVYKNLKIRNKEKALVSQSLRSKSSLM